MLSRDDCECVQHSLLLIRNILHAPQRPRNTSDDAESAASSAAQQPSNAQTPHQGPTQSYGCSYTTAECNQQNQRLLWNLFAQRLDRLLINLLASPQKVYSQLLTNFGHVVSCFVQNCDRPGLLKLPVIPGSRAVKVSEVFSEIRSA